MVFRFYALLGRILRLLAVFLSDVSAFFASWSALGSILEGFGMLRGGFWRFQGLILKGFWMLLHAPALAWLGCSDPYKTLAGVVRNAHRSMLAIQRMTQKTNKNRPDSFSNKQFGQERVQISIWSAPRRILEKFRHLPSASWPALGRLSGSLGRFLGSSWVLLGRSWASLSSSRTPLGRILPPQDLPNLDFGGSGDVLGWFLQGFGAVFGHAFCCVSRFVISRGHNLSLVIATPFLPHACALCTTFLTQCLHFGTSCFYWCSNHDLALTTALCFLSFWCGGLCAAHPPPPEGRAERAKRSLKFFLKSSCLNI